MARLIEELFGSSPFEPLLKHTQKVHECVKLLRPLMEETIEENYDIKGPNWSNKSTVTFSKDEKIIMKFRINKKSMYITVSNFYNNPINIEKIIKEMSNKLDFGIKDKISLSNNKILEKIDFQNE